MSRKNSILSILDSSYGENAISAPMRQAMAVRIGEIIDTRSSIFDAKWTAVRAIVTIYKTDEVSAQKTIDKIFVELGVAY